jgi:RNA polymerase sigma-70 factor (ECF subfamily)
MSVTPACPRPLPHVALGLVLRISTVDADRSDADVARAVATGHDAAAEALLVRRYAGRIRLYGRRHLRDAAAVDDLVQHVLMTVIEALRAGRLEDPERLSSFVLGTCRNVTWDTHRGEARRRALERALEAVVPPAPAPEALFPLKRLLHCYGHLPDREASVVRMTFLEDRSADEVATRLGLSAGNVRVIKHRALAELGRCVGVEERP